MSAVRWGMLSTAGIGRMVASAVRGSGDTRFVAVASRDAAKARGFAAEFGLPLSFGSYQDLLAWHEVDAVYVPLPVAMHTEWTIRALNAQARAVREALRGDRRRRWALLRRREGRQSAGH